MKALKAFYFFLFFIMLTACGNKDYTLHFKKDMILDFGTNQNTLHLIEAIGNQEVTEDMIEGNSIEIDNFIVSCDLIDTQHLGSYEVVYQTNAVEQRNFTKQILVKDISAPKISIKEEEITLSLKEYKEYNFAEFITVEDNWKEDDPIVNIQIDQIIEAGKSYEVKITAKDKFNNEANEKFTLHIKEEEKIEVEEAPEKEVIQQNPVYQQPSPSLPQPTPVIPPISQPSTETKPSIKPQGRDFLFSDGYTMENVGNACQQALLSSGASGACTPIKDANGIYIGMRLQFY